MPLTTAVSNITLVVLFKPYLIPWPVEHSAKKYNYLHNYICTSKCFIFYVHIWSVTSVIYKYIPHTNFSDNRTISETCICNLNISDLKGGCQFLCPELVKQ